MKPIIKGQTAVAVEYTGNSDDWCNGVVFQVAEKELPAFDRREGGYTRTLLDTDLVKAWHEPGHPEISAKDDAVFWTYCINGPAVADDDFPIPMSYLDVILQGALEVSEKFARHFIEHTYDWNSLLNDRECPVYVRHSELARSAADPIDVLLQELRTDDLSKRRTAMLDTDSLPSPGARR